MNSTILSQFNFFIEGNKSSPKLVFLHGLMGSALNWKKITLNLRDDFEILAFDQRGHGGSFKPQSGYAPDDYADDLFKILKELQWNNVILCGHSMGGRNALCFASKYPRMLNKLIIEDIGPEFAPEQVINLEKLIDSVPTPFENKKKAKEFFFQEFIELHKNLQNPQTLAQFFLTNIIELENEGLADWRFFKKGIFESVRIGRGQDRWSDVEKLGIPCLWIRGENSKELSKEVFKKISLANPLIKCIEIKDAGHWVHYEQPKEFTKALKDFLTESPIRDKQ